MAKAKYQQIADEIRSKILTNEYVLGSAIPSELQLQEDYQMSRHTVRQAIALLVNEGYLRKEKGSGTYVDEQYLRIQDHSEEPKKIGVITTYVSDYIFPSIIRGIEQTLRTKGYSLLLASTNNDTEQERLCLEQMLKQNVSGLIVEPTKSNQYNPNLAYYLSFKEKGIPIVMINARYEELSFPFVSVDDVEVGYQATKHLFENKHESLALITKIDDLQGKYRMKGFIKAHEEAGKIFDPGYLYTYTTETKAQVMEQLIQQLTETNNGITGIVCYNDEIAYELTQVLIVKGKKVPQDFSIVGNDDSFLSRAGHVYLTTLSHPKEVLGETAAEKIVAAIEKEEVTNKIFTPGLIKRQSVNKR